MSIFSDIKDATKGTYKTKDWYRARLVEKLEPFSGILGVGDICLLYTSDAADDC